MMAIALALPPHGIGMVGGREGSSIEMFRRFGTTTTVPLRFHTLVVRAFTFVILISFFGALFFFDLVNATPVSLS